MRCIWVKTKNSTNVFANEGKHSSEILAKCNKIASALDNQVITYKLLHKMCFRMFLNKKSNRWQNVFINVPYFENKFEFRKSSF